MLGQQPEILWMQLRPLGAYLLSAGAVIGGLSGALGVGVDALDSCRVALNPCEGKLREWVMK